jgi:competence protein ComEC
MILFTLSFVSGVWLLQQQASLPDFAIRWLILVILMLSFYLLTQNKHVIPRTCHYLRICLLTSARVLLWAMLAGALGFYWSAWLAQQRLADSLPDNWQGRDIAIIGVIARLPRITDRGQRVVVDVEKTLTDSVYVPKHLYLATYSDLHHIQPILHAAERWYLTVRLKQPHGVSNPHGADFELWALENNLRATGYINNAGANLRLERQVYGVNYRIESWRESIRDKITNTLGGAPYAGILTALVIGDQNSISEEQWQLFRHTGVIHLMSISGLHITMLAGMCFAIIKWLWRQNVTLTLWLPARKAAAIIAVMTAFAYTLLAGYGVPAQRTVYMVTAVSAALLLNRNYSLSQILSIAILGVLIPDPWAVRLPGFILSFGAVALIIYSTAHRIGPGAERLEKNILSSDKTIDSVRFYDWLRNYVTVQWAVGIGLIPLLLAIFWQCSLLSPIANAFAIPMISLLVVPLALTGAVLPTDIPLWLAHIVLDLTMSLLHYLNSLPHTVWIQHTPAPWSILVGVIGVIWLLTPGGFPARWLGGLLMLPMFLNTPPAPIQGSLRLLIFDVGQGLSVAVQTRQHTLLYDTGPDYSGDADSGSLILVPSLHAMGIKSLDGLILSHDDIDHTGGTDSVLQEMPVAWMSSSQKLTTVKKISGKLRYCSDGTRWIWDDVSFEFLHPGNGDFQTSKHARNNELSCVLRISTGNWHILLTGDIEKRAEQRLLRVHADELAANLLVAPHHGSASSSDTNFIAAVLPDYVVFTSGYRNRFGHPKQVVLQRYFDSGAIVLRSDKGGAIIATMNEKKLTVETWRNMRPRYWMHRF